MLNCKYDPQALVNVWKINSKAIVDTTALLLWLLMDVVK